MKEAREGTKYLGLPNMVGRNKNKAFAYLKDKMMQRMHSWKKYWISQPGIEVLVKHVSQAIPVYAMSLFLLPTDITKDFERQITKYWWGFKDNGKPGIHWMN